MARLDRLNERYRAHQGRRAEFVFGSDERAGLIAGLVGGPGLRVLDLGCRTGALTQHYADGNDVVVAGELLEHLRDPARLVADARRVLRPGGTLVGSVPNAYRLKSRIRFLRGRRPEDDRTHLQMFSPDDLRALLRGFDDVSTRFAVGRYARVLPHLTARVQVFSARKPR